MTNITYKVMSIRKFIDNDNNTICEVVLQGVPDKGVNNSFMTINLTDATEIGLYESNLGKLVAIPTGIAEVTSVPTT